MYRALSWKNVGDGFEVEQGLERLLTHQVRSGTMLHSVVIMQHIAGRLMGIPQKTCDWCFLGVEELAEKDLALFCEEEVQSLVLLANTICQSGAY